MGSVALTTRTFVVAEPGCTHERSLETMLELIRAAKLVGCDAFKNQYVSNTEHLLQRRGIPDYQTCEVCGDVVRMTDEIEYCSCKRLEVKPYRKWYGWLNYPIEWHEECRQRCVALGLQYGCSTNFAYDLRAVDPYVTFHKRPSFENEDHDWVRAAKYAGKRFIVSAGLLDHDGLLALIEEVDPWGDILHCTSSYPAPLMDLNLKVIAQYSLDGLSDHSRFRETGAAAVAVGAAVIEAHLRLEETPRTNPDYGTAFTPPEFFLYVNHIRDMEMMLGDGMKRIEPAEYPMLRYKVGSVEAGACDPNIR